MQECHPERSEGSLSGERSFAALRMTKRDALFFEMYCPLWSPSFLACSPSPGRRKRPLSTSQPPPPLRYEVASEASSHNKRPRIPPANQHNRAMLCNPAHITSNLARLLRFDNILR